MHIGYTMLQEALGKCVTGSKTVMCWSRDRESSAHSLSLWLSPQPKGPGWLGMPFPSISKPLMSCGNSYAYTEERASPNPLWHSSLLTCTQRRGLLQLGMLGRRGEVTIQHMRDLVKTAGCYCDVVCVCGRGWLQDDRMMRYGVSAAVEVWGEWMQSTEL